MVSNLDEEIRKYQEVLGLDLLGTEIVEEQKVRVALFDVGGVNIELMEPLSEDSPVSNFLEKKGGGIHHLAFEEGDLDSRILALKRRNIRLIDSQPRKGAHGSKIVFLHPKSFSGVLLEMVDAEK